MTLHPPSELAWGVLVVKLTRLCTVMEESEPRGVTPPGGGGISLGAVSEEGKPWILEVTSMQRKTGLTLLQAEGVVSFNVPKRWTETISKNLNHGRLRLLILQQAGGTVLGQIKAVLWACV